MSTPVIQHFFDPVSCTLSYVVSAGPGTDAAVIDPVWDYHGSAGRLSTQSCDAISAYCDEQRLNVSWVLETHAHADHISGAQYLKQRFGAEVGIGRGILAVQNTFTELFNLDDVRSEGLDFDRLFSDGDRIPIGELTIEVIGSPGHTPDGVCYRVGSSVFLGDTLFAPDFGSARADFPGADAGELYDTVQKLLSFPDDTALYLCHDYQPGGRELQWRHTVAEQRRENIHVGSGITREEFVGMRTERDADLPVPGLLIPAIQVNIRAGKLPQVEGNGTSYLKIPINRLG